MKQRGKQTLPRAEQKLRAQIYARLGKSVLQSKGQKGFDRHISNANRIAHDLARMRYNDIADFKLIAYQELMRAARDSETNPLEKAGLESLHGTCRHIATAIGKPDMIHKQSKVAMGEDGFYRTASDRINPQYHTSDTDRRERAAAMTAKDPVYGMAADNSYYNGTRKFESLASCEFLTKGSDGKLYTTAGNSPGVMREITIKQMRYAFTRNIKDASFEKVYLANMRPDMKYVVTLATFAKHSRPRLSPVVSDEQEKHCVKCQQFIRENKAAAAEYDRLASKIKSVVAPDKNLDQGYNRLEYIVSAYGGMTKADAGYTLHADRTEYNQRLKALGFSALERARALGHNRTSDLAKYGG